MYDGTCTRKVTGVHGINVNRQIQLVTTLHGMRKGLAHNLCRTHIVYVRG